MRYPLDQFEIGEALGAGGMAIVYDGIHRRSGLPVAIKVMTSKLSRIPAHRRAFLREVRSVARLAHPGIVRVFDAGEISPDLHRLSNGEFTSGSPYLVMERIYGDTLGTHTNVSWPQTRRIVLELLDALAHAHALGVVHRDLKPSNILLDESDGWLVPKLTDFGIARTFDVDGQGALWQGGRKIAGTPSYMAPERVMGQWRDQGAWTDLYSLGILVWKIATGEHPWSGTTQEVLVAHVREDLPVFEPRMDIPERLDQWLFGMLAKSPYQRFRHAADAAVAFREVCRSPTLLLPATGVEETVDEDSRLHNEEVLPTLTAVLERPPQEEYRRQAGLVTEWPRPAMPSDWRTMPVGTGHYRPMLDAGLGLFGLRTIPMVDRDVERDRLWRLLGDVLRGRSTRVVSVKGTAGVGKTRLADWFVARASEVGAADVRRVVASDVGHSFDGLSGMLSRLFRVEDLDDHDAASRVRSEVREVTQGRDPIAEYDAVALAQIVLERAEQDDGRQSVEFMTPAERFLAIARVLRSLSHRRAQILWIEDAHLAIDAVRFVRFLLEETAHDAPLLILLCSRTEGPYQSDSLRDDLAAIADHERTSTISIGRMDDDTMGLLVRRTLGLAPELTDDVVRRAEGTAMFAVQAVSDWVERNALVLGEHGYQLASESVDIADDVHVLWSRRVERLIEKFAPHSDSVHDALLLAALLGRWVDNAEWAHCTQRLDSPSSNDLLDAVVEELVRLGLAERQADGWSFAHALMRESLLRLCRTSGRWAALHSICAISLERICDITSPPDALRIANHRHQCDDDVAALDVLLSAIRGAKAAHDYHWLERLLAAANRVTESLALEDDDARRGTLAVTRVRILTARNQLIEAQTTCEQIIVQARQYGWLRVEGEATFQLGSNALSLGHTDRAIELFLRSHALFDQLDEVRNLARTQEGVGYAYLHQGRYHEAKRYVESAGALYEELGELRGIAFNLYHRGIIARYEGDTVTAREYYEECRRLASRMGYRDTLANAHNALGDLERHAGRLDAACTHYQDAFDLWSAIGASGANVSSINLGIAMVQQGQWDEATAVLMPLTERLQRENATMQLTFAIAATLPIYAARREEAAYDLALERFEAFRATYELHDPDLDLLRDLCIDAWLALNDGARVAATRYAFGER